MAKDLKAFMERASEDKNLGKKLSKAKSAEELRSIAADAGFELTDSDINNVSGGGLLPSFAFDNVRANLNLFSKEEINLNQSVGSVDGTNNTIAFTGSQTYDRK